MVSVILPSKALLHFRQVLHQVHYPNLLVEAHQDGPHRYSLRVASLATTDARTGTPWEWKGRHWRLSKHMTDGEIVQTAFLAIMTALEHEAREVFTYKGAAVFDGHYDIDKLVAFRKSEGAIRGRS